MRGKTAIAILAALAAGAAGCGGTDLSLRQLRVRATITCERSARRLDRIRAPTQPIGGAPFLARGTAVLAPELARLERLHAPSDKAKTYRTAIAAFSQKLHALDAALLALRKGADPEIEIKTLQRHLAPVESVEDRAWQELGVPACVNR